MKSKHVAFATGTDVVFTSACCSRYVDGPKFMGKVGRVVETRAVMTSIDGKLYEMIELLVTFSEEPNKKYMLSPIDLAKR